MKLLVCSVYDVKVRAYMTPFFVRSRGEALRSFEDACRDEKSPFYRHGGDYSLCVIGEFDDDDGLLEALKPLTLCSAADFVVRPVDPVVQVVSGANGSPLSS